MTFFFTGKLIGNKDGLTELLHIPNSAKILNLKDPEPGMWSIKVNIEPWPHVKHRIKQLSVR